MSRSNAEDPRWEALCMPVECVCEAVVELNSTYGCDMCRAAPMCRACYADHIADHEAERFDSQFPEM